MTEPSYVLLRNLADELGAAIQRLMHKPKALHPFVVIDDAATGRLFVQFAGSDAERLLFDVPATGHQCHYERDVDLAPVVRIAVETLRSLGLDDDTLLRVFEEDDSRRFVFIPNIATDPDAVS